MLRFRYQTFEFGKTDIHVRTLRDRQQFFDPEDAAANLGISSANWPMFGVIWPSSLVLAHHIYDYKTKGKRILEIGCGMALSSLLLNKQDADITATDYHPEAGLFLQTNTELNNDNDIDYERVDWANKNDSLGRFDLIIGSDLLYEDEHITLLSDFIENHAQPVCEIIIVDPGRGRKNKLSARMLHYGFSCEQEKPVHTDYLEQAFKGVILTYRRG